MTELGYLDIEMIAASDHHTLPHVLRQQNSIASIAKSSSGSSSKPPVR